VNFGWDANRSAVGGPEPYTAKDGWIAARRDRHIPALKLRPAIAIALFLPFQSFEAPPYIEHIAATMTKPCNVAVTAIGVAPGNRPKLVT
jgi:hypothetical protein